MEATDLGTLLVGWGLVLASLATVVTSLLLAPGVLGALGILSYRSLGSLMAGLTIGTLSPTETELSCVLASPPVLEAGLGVRLGAVSRTMILTLAR